MDDTIDPPVPLPLTQAQERALKKDQEEWDKKDDICFSTLMKALIRYKKTKRMVEVGKFEHAYEIMRFLERRYNTHNQVAKSALTLAFHSLKT